MEILEKLFLNIFQTSINASIVIVTFIIVTKFFDKKISIKIKYTLWILVIIRFLVPVMPESGAKTINIAEKLDKLKFQNQSYQSYQREENISSENINEKIDNKETTDKEVISSTSVNTQNITSNNETIKNDSKKVNIISIIKKITAFIWSVGFFALNSVLILGALHFKKRSTRLDKDKYNYIFLLTEELSNKLNIHRSIQIFTSNEIKSPCITGIIKPKIFIPKYILDIDDNNKLIHIFLHELIHFKRKDLYFNFLSIIAISLHWFNPLAWIAINNVRNYREYVCDASVLEFLGEDKNIEYGTTLIDCSRRSLERNRINTSVFNAVVCFEDKNQIKERIIMIKGFKNGSIKVSKRGALCCLVAVGLIFSGGVVVFNKNESNIQLAASNENIEEEKYEEVQFIVDNTDNYVGYNDINRAKRVMGYDFKLPNYFIDGNYYWGTNIKQTSCSILEVNYNEEDSFDGTSLNLYIFKGNPADALRTLETYYGNTDAESEENELSIGNIKGKEIIVKDEAENIDYRYFAFEENDVWYCLQYKGINIDISQEEVSKVVESFVDFSELNKEKYTKNVELSDSEIRDIDNIYTKSDFEEVVEAIGFNAKIPVNVSDDVKTAVIRYAGAKSEPENFYLMDITYTNSEGYYSIHLVETKVQEGHSLKEVMGEKTEKLTNTDIDVYKDVYNGEYLNEIIYFWEEDGVIYQLSFNVSEGFNDNDELVRKFIKVDKMESENIEK